MKRTVLLTATLRIAILAVLSAVVVGENKQPAAETRELTSAKNPSDQAVIDSLLTAKKRVLETTPRLNTTYLDAAKVEAIIAAKKQRAGTLPTVLPFRLDQSTVDSIKAAKKRLLEGPRAALDSAIAANTRSLAPTPATKSPLEQATEDALIAAKQRLTPAMLDSIMAVNMRPTLLPTLDKATPLSQTELEEKKLAAQKSQANKPSTEGPALVPPPNDLCAAAMPIGNVVCFPFSNVGALTDGPLGDCPINGDPNIGSDIWYIYTACGNGTVTVSLCPSAPGYDTKLGIYLAGVCPPPPGPLACNDDFCGLLSQVSFPATTGTSYLIRIGGFFGAQGTGCMSISFVPSNDNCASATPIGEVTNLPFCNVGATTDGPPGSCSVAGADIWYCYTASCTDSITISLCGSSFDTYLEVFSGCVCPPAGPPLVCNDDFCGLQSQVSFKASGGTSYLIRVAGFAGAQGSGLLNIQPANDNCANAIPIGETPCTPFCTIGATTDGPPGACSPTGSDIWYCYTASCTSPVTISLCGSSYDTYLEVFNAPPGCAGGCPPGGAPIACNDDNPCCGLSSQVTFPAMAGNSYLVRIGGFVGQQGSGLLSICCGTPPPNDCCANAAPIGEVTNLAFSNSCATTDGPADCLSAGDPQIGSDIWFCYTASCTSPVTVSLCGSSYDTKLAVYDGCGCLGPQLACNDDFCGLQSEVTFAATAGNKYMIRIGGYNCAQGNGFLNICCGPLPPNDACTAAIPVGNVVNLPFSTFCSTPDGFGPICDGFSNIWYVFTASITSTVTVSLCGSAYDTKLGVYDGVGCNPVGPQLLCNDDFCGLQSQGTFPAVGGNSYLIEVSGFGGQQGNGVLSICDRAKGDMNGDGGYTAADVVLLLNCVFLGTGSCDLCFADVNCSGGLTAADVVLELNHVFLGSPFPC